MLGRRQEAGSTSSVGLVVAAIVFAGAFIVAQLMVAEPGGMDAGTARLDQAAQTSLDLMISEPGRTLNGKGWADDPDTMLRFGLAREGVPNFLDYDKVKALRNGTMSSSSNDAPDYPEVKEAMGLEGMDFHIRSFPVLPSLSDPRWTKDNTARVAYFAHYSGANTPTTLLHWTNQSADALNVSVQVINDGSFDATYTVSFSLGNEASRSTFITAERHTKLLRPGEYQTVWHRFPQLVDYDNRINSVLVEVVDPYGNHALDPSGTTVGSAWFPATVPEGGSLKQGLLVLSAESYYESGDTVTFYADHHDGEGGHVSGTAPAARFVLVGPNEKEWVNQSITLPTKRNKVWEYACPNCTTVGNYTAVLWDDAVQRRHVEHAHVSAGTMFTQAISPSAVALSEMGIIEDLTSGFDRTRYSAATPEGDVFPDDVNGPSDIVEQLPRYSTLVIGSEVSQTALNAASTKYAIRDWVEAGGNLVVLGTYQQQSRWLQPVYHAAQVTANGGISAPDPTHPVLTVPNKVEYDRYLDRGRAWDIRDDQPFTHILSRGSGGTSYQDTLAVSAPGAYNDGTVVLTSYMPGALTNPQDAFEAKKLMHNLLSQSHSMLFMDFGPPVPDGVPVGTAQRLVAVPHPNVPDTVVEVRLIVYTW